VWVDETGNRGTATARSPFFTFAAVIIRADAMPQLMAAKRAINERLARAPAHELHWSENLKSHDSRFVAAEGLRHLPMRLIYVTLDKSRIPKGAYLGESRDAKYNYPLRLLLERVSWLMHRRNGMASITLAAVRGLPKKVPVEYVEKLKRLGSEGTAIRWDALHPKINVEQTSAKDGLQVADIAAGALDRAVRPADNPPHRIEPAYLIQLGSRIYVGTDGKISSYGLKAIAPSGFWRQFPWWDEVARFPKNA